MRTILGAWFAGTHEASREIGRLAASCAREVLRPNLKSRTSSERAFALAIERAMIVSILPGSIVGLVHDVNAVRDTAHAHLTSAPSRARSP
jgi:hypothetical protein